MLLRVFEPVDDAGCDDRILNSLVRFIFEILCEEGVGLDGRGDAQQFLGGRNKIIRIRPRVATRYDPHLVHLTNEILAFRRFLTESSLLKVVAYLHATLNVCTWQRLRRRIVTLWTITHSKLSNFLLISSGKSLNFVAFENRTGPVG